MNDTRPPVVEVYKLRKPILRRKGAPQKYRFMTRGANGEPITVSTQAYVHLRDLYRAVELTHAGLAIRHVDRYGTGLPMEDLLEDDR